VPFLLELAWRELRVNGRSLWVFCACLMLGVVLVAAAGGLYRVVSAGLLLDTRMLLGGDLEVDSNTPLPPEALAWIEQNGDLSLVIELDTMLGTADGNFLRVELQTVDSAYPLYGRLGLEPAISLQEALAMRDGRHGAALDAALAQRLDIGVGDEVYVGALALQVRTIVVNQPDRRLSADWRGAPLLLSEAALQQTALVQPGSRIEYEYNVRTETPAETWRAKFYASFPAAAWEVRTFRDRSQRIAERLNQIASGLLIIGLSTLFIGGLGVFNSIETYLQGRLRSIATLRAIGLRRRPLAIVYLLQIGILSCGASFAGALLALLGTGVIAAQVPIGVTAVDLLLPALIAFGFGVLTAFAFTFPALGRALRARPAALFRGEQPGVEQTPPGWWLASLACAACLVILVLLALPDLLFGLGFVLLVAALLLLLECVVRAIRHAARTLENRESMPRSFALRFALASLLRAINTTIPQEAPALVLYDVLDNQAEAVTNAVLQAAPGSRVDLVPLVRSRIATVNGRPLADRPDTAQARMRDVSRGDYKLSYRASNIDDVTLVAGDWWDESASDMPRMAIEDREAGRLGVGLGDRIGFSTGGHSFTAEITAIYSQKGLQTRFWFEGIVSDGALDSVIHRRVGAAYLDDATAIEAQQQIARTAPNVITVRTAMLLETARGILGKAASGLAIVAGVSLAASLLVLISVMAAGRTRQIYDATVLHALGARHSLIRSGLRFEYLLLAGVTSLFATGLGAAIALPLMRYRLKLPADDLLWLGALVACAVSSLSLALGARYLLRRLRVNPARLLITPPTCRTETRPDAS